MTDRLLLLTLILALAASLANADTVHLRSGKAISGIVLQTNENSRAVLLMQDHTTSDHYIPEIESIDFDTSKRPSSAGSTNRTPHWQVILWNLSKQPWAANIRQIPATVIDKGILRHVPYVSFRCGGDYEINIYGDLDAPAGFEIGVSKALLTDEVARSNCVAFLASLLPASEDQGSVRGLSRAGQSVTRDGLLLEITPPTDPDSYGGWWVGVYNESELDSVRASKPDLERITVSRSAPTVTPSTGTGAQEWTPQDLRLARPPQPAAIVGNSAPAGDTYSGSGQVYVRGYFRRDGTYVQPHTRSAPRRR